SSEVPSIAAECCTIYIAWQSDLLGGQFITPQGIGVDSSGNVYVTDSDRNDVQKFDSDGEHILAWGSQGTDEGQFTFAQQVATDSSGNVYVTDNSENRVQKFDSDGNFILEWDSALSSAGELSSPAGIAIDSADDVYVVDSGNGRIQKFDSDGNFILEWGQFGSGDGEFDRPYGIATDSFDNVYVTDYFRSNVQKFDSDGAFFRAWGTDGSADGEFSDVRGIAIDSSDNVYVADAGNNRIQKFDSEGVHLASWGSSGSDDGEFDYPVDIATSSSDDVYVIDLENIRIQQFTTDGEFVLEFGVFQNDDIVYTKSTDAGATFSDPVNLTDNAGGSSAPALLPSGDNLYLAWDEFSWIGVTPTPSDIMLYKSTNEGDTFGEAFILDDNDEDAFIPRLAKSDRDVYVAWQGYTGESEHDIFFRSLPEFNNGSPEADAGTDQAVNEGDLVTLDGGGTDPEDDELTFSWEQVDGPEVTLSSSAAESPTFTAPSIISDDTLTFELTVSDGVSGATDTVTVSVDDSKGDLTIRKVGQGTDTPLAGATFTLTPNPFTLAGSLVVEDNDGVFDRDSIDGIIALQNVEFGTYTIEETVTPDGFVRIVQNVVVSVHSTQQDPTVTVENKVEDEPVEEPITIPSPDLTSVEFNNFVLKGAVVGEDPVTTVNDLPPALLVAPDDLSVLPDEISFTTEAPSDSTTQELIDLFTIPTYTSPEQDLAAGNVYVVPPIVIGHDDSDEKFLMTPLLSDTVSGMTLLFDDLVSTSSGTGQIKTVEMTFSDDGVAQNVAFSVSITDEVPEDAPLPDEDDIETSAMYLTVDFVGIFDDPPPDFSSEDAFAESPRVSVLIDADLDVDQLDDGCPDVSFFFLDESVTPNVWIEIAEPERDSSLDTAGYCGYVLETGHWSKFAVGGVKLGFIPDFIGGHGGGRSSPVSLSGSAAVTPGANSATSVSIPGVGTIKLNFDNVSVGGSVRASTSSFSQMSGLFTWIAGDTAMLSIPGSDQIVPYSTI
ncbi:MAG TPA: 6-bladed beta-propeller, partial [Nitrospiraceae bacterium]